MTLFLCNILLAFLWATTIGTFTMANFIAGYFLGALALYAGVPTSRKGGYITNMGRVFALGVYFLYELVVANAKMVMLVLGPMKHIRPAILRIPLKPGLTDLQLTTLANMITLTPGTLSLDISKDRSSLFVHFMHAEDSEADVEQIKQGFERRIAEIA